MKLRGEIVGLYAALSAAAAQGQAVSEPFAQVDHSETTAETSKTQCVMNRVCGSIADHKSEGLEPKPGPAALRPGWLVLPLPQGAELRFLPLAVTFKDYPKAARRAGEEGTSHLSLEVDPSGHIIGCTTARSSGSPALDEQACQLYRTRGRFELLGTTRPVTVQAPVKWKLID